MLRTDWGFNAMMLIRFVFSAHRLGFLMLLGFVALDWVPIRFVFECYSDWGFECHMPQWNPLIKKLFDSLVYKFVHNMQFILAMFSMCVHDQ